MRISDWSSDVCSSDLDDHRPEQDRKPRRGGRDHAAAKRDDPASGIAAELRADQETVAFPVSLMAKRRSEEHTSELQSLMRISYAVFCLKKKNNKHIYNTQRKP